MMNKKILIVEDEAIVAMDLQGRLEAMGYAVAGIAYSGEEAVKKTEENRPDLVLMDIKLQGEADGIGTAIQIRRRFAIPVVYLTAYADEDTVRRAKTAEPYGYIIKPFDERELRIIIEVAFYKYEMERKLKEDEKWFNITLKSIGDAVIATDTCGKVKFINTNASLITAWKIEEAKGRDLKEVFRVVQEKQRAALDIEIEKALKEGIIVNLVDSVLLNRNGEEINVDVNAAPIKEDNGSIIGMVVAFHDVSERRRIDRIKDDLISNVSHEMRTPLTSIREAVSQILDGILGDITPQQRKFLNIGLTNIDRLKRIIDGLLDIAKIEAGQMKLKKDRVDIVRLVKETVDSFSSEFQSKNLQLKTVLPDRELDVYADKDKIIQVISSLLVNTLRFTEEGYVEIIAEDKDDYVFCSVKDTGRGVSEEDLHNMFDRFQQFKREAGPGEKGTGLGMAISKGIIELHGGKLWVESKLNEGSKFAFSLPKYSIKEVLREDVVLRIIEAGKENKEFAIFLIKADNYEQIGRKLNKEKVESIFAEMKVVLGNTFRKGDFVTIGDNDKIFVLIDVDEKNINKVNSRLKQAVKGFIFKLGEEIKIDVSCGYALYPSDSGSFEELLEKCANRLVNIKEERLRKNIIIVDDDADSVRVLKKELQVLGYTNITEAYSGRQFFEKIKVKNPDFIILDIIMPEMNGYEIIGRLKDSIETKDIPVLIITGYELEEDKVEKYLREKAMLAITKPFNVEKVKRFLEYLL